MKKEKLFYKSTIATVISAVCVAALLFMPIPNQWDQEVYVRTMATIDILVCLVAMIFSVKLIFSRKSVVWQWVVAACYALISLLFIVLSLYMWVLSGFTWGAV